LKIGIVYPKERNRKIKTLRLLKKRNIEMNKLTAIIDTAEDITNELIGLGNKLVDLEYSKEHNAKEPIDNKYKKGFEILNRVFLRAIAEKNSVVMNFIRNNLTKEEVDFLKEVSKNVVG